MQKVSIKDLAKSLKNPGTAKEQTVKTEVDQKSIGNVEKPENKKEGLKKDAKKEKQSVKNSHSV